MDAYTLVDGAIRRKLEEMLKTWKEPVPGSLDSRPVFPIEVTRRIENALIKARTAAIQLQQQQAKSLQGRAQPSWRGTSTPSPGPQVGRMNHPPTTQLPGYSLPARYGQGQAMSSLIPPEPVATGTLALNGSQVSR
jgi:pre-mRNA cleavage complex 2 protein Pcf11